jgi:hypothetical protein
MTEGIVPVYIVVPKKSTTEINTISGASCISGTMFYNNTLGKLEFYNGTAICTVTSVAR